MSVDISDLENPDWEPFATDGAMTFDQDRHGHPGVLTIHGVKDILSHLKDEAAEEVEHWLEQGAYEKDVPDWLRSALPMNLPAPVMVLTEEMPAASFSMESFILPAGGEPTLISARVDAIRRIVTNSGNNDAQLSHENDTDASGSGLNSWVDLPHSGVALQRTIRAKGRIWAWSSAGTVVDVHSEYGRQWRDNPV